MKKMATNKKTVVLFLWEVENELKAYLIEGLKSYTNVELIFPENAEKATFLKYAPKADIIVGWRPTEELLNIAMKLKLFLNPGVGVQHLIELFKKLNESHKVILCNGHGNTYFVAQHCVALLLSLMNKIVPHHNWMVEGQWRKGDEDAASTPLRNCEIGLLGYGAINTKVHKFLAGFEVNFHILKRDWSKKRVESIPTSAKTYTFNDLELFLKEINILVVAIPLTSLTKGMIGMKELQLLGKDSFVVTVARGEIIDEESFYVALKEKIIAGAAIDVWYNYHPEPNTAGHKFPSKFPFYNLDNVILSPHRGASPMNDLQRWNEVIENVIRFANDEKDFLNVVDLENEY